MRLLIVPIILLLFGCHKQEQYSSILKNLEENHQKCLDQGKSMMLCSRNYSIQMDSMLNVVYKDLMKNISPKEQDLLRIEEREWMKKRDKELEKIWADVNRIKENEVIIPEDDRMFAYNKEAQYIKERVEELALRLEFK